MQCQRLYVRLHGRCDGEQFGIGTVGSLRTHVVRSGIPRPSGLGQTHGTSTHSSCRATTGRELLFASFWDVLYSTRSAGHCLQTPRYLPRRLGRPDDETIGNGKDAPTPRCGGA